MVNVVARGNDEIIYIYSVLAKRTSTSVHQDRTATCVRLLFEGLQLSYLYSTTEKKYHQ